MYVFWLTQSLQEVPSALDWLHPGELQALNGYNFPKKKNDWKLGRWTAKNAIRTYISVSHPEASLKAIEVRKAEDGAPVPMLNDTLLPLSMSISHSHGLGFCTLCSPKIAIGCDLEKIEARSELLVKDHFTANEQRVISDATDNNYPIWTNLIWSAKESALKAIRKGLRIDTKKIEIAFTEGPEGIWNELEARYPEESLHFSGFWRSNEGFIYTIISDRADLVPEEIKLD